MESLFLFWLLSLFLAVPKKKSLSPPTEHGEMAEKSSIYTNRLHLIVGGEGGTRVLQKKGKRLGRETVYALRNARHFLWACAAKGVRLKKTSFVHTLFIQLSGNACEL